jgi:L-rhamnose isomerase
VVTFTAAGSPKAVADRIEQCAVAQGNLTALVVPWESDRATLNMAVTAVRGDGWAIEHTNLGTITLRALGDDATSVTIAPDDPDHPEKQKLASVFERFAEQVQQTVRAAS